MRHLFLASLLGLAACSTPAQVSSPEATINAYARCLVRCDPFDAVVIPPAERGASGWGCACIITQPRPEPGPKPVPLFDGPETQVLEARR